MAVRITARHLAVTLAAAASGTALTVLVPASAVADHELTPVPCSPRADACIDLSEDLSWLMEGGAVTYGPVWISHGAEGYETPPGVFQVSFKNRDHVSSIYGTPMPYSVFFNGGIAFHEGDLDYESAGCVRLYREDAETYFNELQPGDIVEVVE
jgi:hypothetical protein